MTPLPSESYPPKTITMKPNGIQFSYIDTGAPNGVPVYATIFAIHGLAFTSRIFEKVMNLAPASGIRIVAIDRRDYGASTPIPAEDIVLLKTGTDEERAKWLSDRGTEYLRFIDALIQQESLPPISTDGKSGGVAVLGWSLGCAFANAAIASIGVVDGPIQARFAQYLRSHILFDPPSFIVGRHSPEGTWNPLLEEFIPFEKRAAFSLQWISGYFRHGDLATHDPKVLEFQVPTTARIPTMFTLHSELPRVFDERPPARSDYIYRLFFREVFGTVYRKAFFDSGTRRLLPNLKTWEISASSTVSFGIAAYWSIQEDNEAHGGDLVNFSMIHGGNHFAHWDDPEKTIEAFSAAVA